MTSLKKKISHLIGGQLPEFVRSEYPRFVQFLEAYYRFLEQHTLVDPISGATEGELGVYGANDLLMNSDSWADVDTTLNEFVAKMRAQYSWDIPDSTLVESRWIIKNISQYYDVKGSIDGTTMFFRMLFDGPVSVRYPSEHILRASDGRWSKKFILKLDTENYEADPFELQGRRFQIVYDEFVLGEGVVTRSHPADCLDVVKLLSGFMYKLEIDSSFSINLENIGTIAQLGYFAEDYVENLSGPNAYAELPTIRGFDSGVYVRRGNITYGTLSRQLLSVDVSVNAGTLFNVGEVYNIEEDSGPEDVPNRAVITIDSVDPITGSIKRASILKAGYRFEDTMFDVVIGAEREFGTAATLNFNAGLVHITPGQFLSSSGFLSDVNRLEDNYLYQTHSYVIRTDHPLISWEKAYRTSAHPAGYKFFGEYVITNDIGFEVTTEFEREIIPT